MGTSANAGKKHIDRGAQDVVLREVRGVKQETIDKDSELRLKSGRQ